MGRVSVSKAVSPREADIFTAGLKEKRKERKTGILFSRDFLLHSLRHDVLASVRQHFRHLDW